MTIKMTDLLEEIVSKLYEGRKKKGDDTAGRDSAEVTVRKYSDEHPYGKIEKKKVDIVQDKSMSSSSKEAKAAAKAGGKKADTEQPQKKVKGKSSGYDPRTSAERAKRTPTGDAEKAAIDSAKKELESWQERKKLHKKAELKSVRRAVARDEYIARKSQAEKEKAAKESGEKAKKKAERKEFFKKTAKKQKGEQ